MPAERTHSRIRLFLILWGSWTGAALFAAPLAPVSFLILLIVWYFQLHMEIGFRREHLPAEGHRPWHAIMVPFVLTIPLLVGYLGHRYESHLPGSVRHRSNSQARFPGEETGDRVLHCHVKAGWSKANWGPGVRAVRFTETALWAEGEEKNAWVIDPGMVIASSRSNPSRSIELNREGYRQLLRQLFGGEPSAPQIEAAAATLGTALERRNAADPELSFDLVSAGFSGATSREGQIPWH